MKKMLLINGILMASSIMGMEQQELPVKFKLRLTDKKEDLTPVIKMGLSIYEELIDKQKISADEKVTKKEITARKAGYIQAMVNAGDPNWPFVLIEENNETIGFAAGELIEAPKAIVLYMMPMKNRLLYAKAAQLLIPFVKENFPDKKSVITFLEPKGKRSFLSKLATKTFGFKECGDYTPNPQIVWPGQNCLIPYMKKL